MNINGKRADLHIHSLYSDGAYNVDQLFALALEKSIDLISITDHDTIKSIPELKRLSRQYGVEVVNGVELSADFKGREVHILNYAFEESSPELNYYLNDFALRRVERVRQTLDLLNGDGIELTMEDVIVKNSPSQILGRPHIAAALVNKGYAKNMFDAFKRFIGDDKKFCIKKRNESVEFIIDLIKKSGGMSFIAHPGQNLRGNELSQLIKLGFDGIEVVHPAHDKYSTNYFIKVAEEHGLIQSGGSDFHGKNKQDFENFGNFYIPYYKLNSLLN
ncbi:MAG: PHP domain-containing protein [Ignavibacteriaceae bacterium]|jgi:Predicted metal-dependent phosphoesterases (PHP family)|nr:MAG: PHP domain-containing protein [Chlorobiota bacterium]KXK03120.1 MAG: PHP family metal-dependent phosphoesterase [Chlorobi bacterium OLB4]MBV6397852.1 Phosphoribosyl 1,2-cyclic phosphate 1,2-diphosphodiesterase [Ignavibacteria bacterium]MCC6886894.1 PHP domain-containing protein [Ignavibacteriales bacterium]MCE7953982.1 PHP domain-containing protein [Chlorobi bacterium CHB7]MDL1887882.1 PHP domain-containing protein [Ignavibacteria bacterium CHB1]MEB2330331.1 PHP domain-containing prot